MGSPTIESKFESVRSITFDADTTAAASGRRRDARVENRIVKEGNGRGGRWECEVTSPVRWHTRAENDRQVEGHGEYPPEIRVSSR